jgi:hypothetical protein
VKLVALAWHILRNHETEAFLIKQGEPLIPFDQTRLTEIFRTIRALVVIILIGMLAEPDGEHGFVASNQFFCIANGGYAGSRRRPVSYLLMVRKQSGLRLGYFSYAFLTRQKYPGSREE